MMDPSTQSKSQDVIRGWSPLPLRRRQQRVATTKSADDLLRCTNVLGEHPLKKKTKEKRQAHADDGDTDPTKTEGEEENERQHRQRRRKSKKKLDKKTKKKEKERKDSPPLTSSSEVDMTDCEAAGTSAGERHGHRRRSSLVPMLFGSLSSNFGPTRSPRPASSPPLAVNSSSTASPLSSRRSVSSVSSSSSSPPPSLASSFSLLTTERERSEVVGAGDLRLYCLLRELQLAKYWPHFLAQEILLDDLSTMSEEVTPLPPPTAPLFGLRSSLCSGTVCRVVRACVWHDRS
jgi:hypothetical protein